MKKDKNKLTEDQQKKLVQGAQFAHGGDDIDRLFDEIEKAQIMPPKPKDEESHAE